MNQSISVLTTEAHSQIPFRGAGATIKRFYVYVGTNARSTDTVFTVRKAGADTGLAVTFGSGVTGLQSVATDVAISAGDLWDYKVVTSTGTGGIGWNVALEVETSGQSYNQIGGNAQAQSFSTDSTATYIWLAARCDRNNTELGIRAPAPVAATVSNIGLNVTVNSRITDTVVRFRKNGADGSQTFTIPAGTTGYFEDTTNTDTVAAGDTINLSLTTSTGGGTLSWTASAALYTPDAANQSITIGGGGGSVGAATTMYSAPWGVVNRSGATAITDSRASTPFAETLAKLYVHVSSNATTTASTVTLQVNGVDTAVVASITAATTGVFSDTSNSVVVAQGDLLSFKTVAGATGAVRVDSVSLLHTAVANVALTGVSATSALGSLVAALAIGLSGLSVTGSLGSTGVTFAVPLVGQGVTGSLGTVTPGLVTEVALSGVSATASLGSVGVAFAIPLSGLGAIASLGIVTAPAAAVPVVRIRAQGVSIHSFARPEIDGFTRPEVRAFSRPSIRDRR